MKDWTQELFFVLCSVAVAMTNTDGNCWLKTTFQGIPYITSTSYTGTSNLEIHLDESQLKEITDLKTSVDLSPKFSGKPFYTDFQDSALAKIGEKSNLKTLNWVPIYITSVCTQTGGAILMCVEPEAINVTVMVKEKNKDADPNASPLNFRIGKIYKYLCKDDFTPWITDLAKWSGKVVLEFVGEEPEAFKKIKEIVFGEYAVKFLFISVQNGIWRRFVCHSNYIRIGGKFVGDVVSTKVKFWIRPNGADCIILVDADIEEFTRKIKILGSAKPSTLDVEKLEEVKSNEASKWRKYLKMRTGHNFGICRLPLSGSKTQLLGITIDKNEDVKITRRGIGIFNYFKDVEIKYKYVEQP